MEASRGVKKSCMGRGEVEGIMEARRHVKQSSMEVVGKMNGKSE